MSILIDVICSPDPAMRNRPVDAICRGLSKAELLQQAASLDRFRRGCDNLYDRVRALFFLYTIHRFHLPKTAGVGTTAELPSAGYEHLLKRRFEEAIDLFLEVQGRVGLNDGLSSALAQAYYRLGFQTLADQVRHSVRSVRGNQWMFRTGHPADHPLRVHPLMTEVCRESGLFPMLREATPVRMDLSHSGWSDIFFLGMDFPEGARVFNVSIDLAVRGVDAVPRPPIEAFFRVIDRPVLRLASLDLEAAAEITELGEVFDFARDYLGLLKAAVIASGVVPPGMEGACQPLSDLLERLVGPGHGIELVSSVRGIPKGSRLAVSTNLLASLIAVCMRATAQTAELTGPLSEGERRLVAARAILGEWLGGSGGGWQDSGGVWPGMKLIQGESASEGDPEYGISRGRLLPSHRIISAEEVGIETRRRLQDSLILVHGGMAQDVGPILEMVTEKYLLRCEAEWTGRAEAMEIFDRLLEDLRAGDIHGIGAGTQRNFFGPIQTIIPWASNDYTERLVARAGEAFGADFWGFWMLGGMAGGGMGFLFAPERKQAALDWLGQEMSRLKRRLEHAVPFAMDPVVYDFAINEAGTVATKLHGADALMPPGYYALMFPKWIQCQRQDLTRAQRTELDVFGQACRTRAELSGMLQTLFDRILPRGENHDGGENGLSSQLEEYGFDRIQHEEIRADLRAGRIGLAQNRLPPRTRIEDVQASDVGDLRTGMDPRWVDVGLEALNAGRVAVVSLAGGVGSRWTKGAGVVKAIHPFCKLSGRHRSFLEIHLAKSRWMNRQLETPLPHIVTTSYLTHAPIRAALEDPEHYGYEGPLFLSGGRAIGLRMVPTVRDLRFAWEEMPQQLLDEQAQKVLEGLHAALIRWAREMGEGSDYTDNLPQQCLHPVGHWYEVPNLFRSGVLAGLLRDRPQLKYLMVHNIDTLGANVDPGVLGHHICSGGDLTMEVITRRVEDRGGGLARVDGRVRLVEGLALPREELEFGLSYYNSNTTWIDLDRILDLFGLSRGDLEDPQRVMAAIREVAARMPTYITLKDVKKRWGKGQEDVFPVAQFEKLWGDMTAIPELDWRYVVVDRMRGQQLKEPAQLDGWLREGSAEYLESICDWP